ncbi:MAG: hypothetical protein N2689_06845 [Verrucomicrobiae bacterium]|nr:hypothetical protein [Verrucomicrobiae bacterium]
MLGNTPAFAKYRLAPRGNALLLSAGWAVAGGLCLLAQPSLAPPPHGPGGTSPVVAAPGQPHAVAQTTTETSNTLSQIIANDPAFQRFTNLVEHSLFTATSAAGAESSGSDVPGFAADLRLTGIIKLGEVIQVSIESRSEPDKKYFVRVGEMIPDTEVKVVSVDFPGRAVVLAKGEEQGRLEYESEAAPAPAAALPPGSPQRPGMPPMGMPGGPPGPRGPMSQPPPPPQAGAGPGGGGGDTRAMRAQNRRQTIERLRQMLQTTTDPAAQQRLRSYIQLLERAAAQEQ